MKNPKNIAITGASSGIGAALARHYAAPGITLYLHGRNKERLEQVAAACKKSGATVHIHVGDVRDAEDMRAWLADKPLNLAIANAGISAGIGGGGESAAQAKEIFAINVDGVANTVYAALGTMQEQGQIAIISSLAGIRGLPSSPAYSASKASVRVWGEGLRGWLRPTGIHVCVVCPGFVRTPLTDVNPYHMPFLMEPEKAARLIARGLAKNKPRIAFPWQLYWPLLLLGALPMPVVDKLLARLPGKPSL